MSQKRFSVGVIGTGGIFRAVHAAGWKSIPGVEIVAVCDVSRDRAEMTAKEVGAQHVFTDFEDLVKLDLDAVDVCTPNEVHTPAVIAALETGKHVICEKPLATRTETGAADGQIGRSERTQTHDGPAPTLDAGPAARPRTGRWPATWALSITPEFGRCVAPGSLSRPGS